MSEKDRPNKSAPHSNAPNYLHGIDVMVAQPVASDEPQGYLRAVHLVGAQEQGRRRQLLRKLLEGARRMREERERQEAAATPPPSVEEKIDALTKKVDRLNALLVGAHAELATVRGALQGNLTGQPQQPAPVVINQGADVKIDIAVKPECDRTHPEDVMEDDAFYVDLAKKGPRN
mgnify:CR=1 FL=1